jgi:hypothetical protein
MHLYKPTGNWRMESWQLCFNSVGKNKHNLDATVWYDWVVVEFNTNTRSTASDTTRHTSHSEPVGELLTDANKHIKETNTTNIFIFFIVP